jgi:hypothetical protein
MVSDAAATKDQGTIEDLAFPFGTLVIEKVVEGDKEDVPLSGVSAMTSVQSEVKQEDTYEVIGVHEWIRSAIDVLANKLKDDTLSDDDKVLLVKSTLYDAYDVFAYGFVSKYAIQGMLTSDELFDADKNRIGVFSNQSLYTQIEKSFINRLVGSPMSITNDDRSMYNDDALL